MVPAVIWRRSSEALGGGRVLHVALPEGYDDPTAEETTYPLVVCLDPQWTFGTTCDAVLNLGLARLIPRAIVVGVGWDATAVRDVLRLRGEAYTPTDAPFPEGVAPRRGGPTPSGGADAYRAWLCDELLPDLCSRYRIRRDDVTLLGHSLSGLFGLSTLFTRPTAFRRYLLASPSIWWDDRAILGFEERYAAAQDDLPARVFVSIGAEEDTTVPFAMVGNATLLTDRLRARAYPSLELDFTVFADELHHSTIPAAISRGLRFLFATS